MGHLLVLEVVVRRGVEVLVSVGGWWKGSYWRGRVSGGRAAICAVLFPEVMEKTESARARF
jgi:hypothetical protein